MSNVTGSLSSLSGPHLHPHSSSLLQPHPDRLTCKLRSRHWAGLAWASRPAHACDPAIAPSVCTSGWRSCLEYHHVSPVLPRPLLNTPLIPVPSFNLHDLAGHNLFSHSQPLTTTGPSIYYRLRSLIPSDSPECVTLTHFHKQTIS